MVLCILAGNFDPLIFVGVMPLGTIRKSTNNQIFLCQFFINEITASDAGPDITRYHLFTHVKTLPLPVKGYKLSHMHRNYGH